LPKETANFITWAQLGKALFWQRLAGVALNERQVKLLNRMLDGFEGKLTSSKWAALANTRVHFGFLHPFQ
jgi:Fic family protein